MQNNITGDVRKILLNEEKRYLSNMQNGFKSEASEEELKYLRYLIENYSYSNLNDIDTKFEQLNSKSGFNKI